MVLDNLATTLSPEDARYINRYELLRERLSSRDIDLLSGIVCDKDEAKRRDEAADKAAQEQQAQTQELLRAEVRKILAESVKNLTQADKNAAAANAAEAETMMQTLNTSLGQLEGDVNVGAESNSGKPEGGAGPVPGNPAPKQGRGDGPSAMQIANNPVGAVSG